MIHIVQQSDSAEVYDELEHDALAEDTETDASESGVDRKEMTALLHFFLGRPDADPTALVRFITNCRERHLASLNTPQRLAKHNAIMQQFIGDGSIPDPGPIMAGISDHSNPLFSELWEPWARKVQYIGAGHSDIAMTAGTIATDGGWRLRTMAVDLFSWAVPTLPLCKFMIDNAPHRKIAEIGSGSGYWSALLSNMGADVIAVDNGTELGGKKPAYFSHTIICDGVEFVQRGSANDRALFFCWARPGDMPARCISAYKGDTVFFVGENGHGMGTFDVMEWLYSEQGKEWKVEARKEVPAWIGLYDSFIMCKRVKNEEIADSKAETEEEAALEQEEESSSRTECVLM